MIHYGPGTYRILIECAANICLSYKSDAVTELAKGDLVTIIEDKAMSEDFRIRGRLTNDTWITLEYKKPWGGFKYAKKVVIYKH